MIPKTISNENTLLTYLFVCPSAINISIIVLKHTMPTMERIHEFINYSYIIVFEVQIINPTVKKYINATAKIDAVNIFNALDIELKRFDILLSQIGSIIAYTSFKNTVVHEPKLVKLLPVNPEDFKGDTQESNTLMSYEPEEDVAFKDSFNYISSKHF